MRLIIYFTNGSSMRVLPDDLIIASDPTDPAFAPQDARSGKVVVNWDNVVAIRRCHDRED